MAARLYLLRIGMHLTNRRHRDNRQPTTTELDIQREIFVIKLNERCDDMAIKVWRIKKEIFIDDEGDGDGGG